MQEDRHTRNTRNEILVPLSFLDLIKARPRIALRRTTDPMLRCAIEAYWLNKGTQAEASALRAVEELL